MKRTIALFTVFFVTSYALACSCMMPPPPPKALEQAAAVFSGKVTKIEGDVTKQRTITIAVDQAWKGVETETVTLTTGPGGGMCGFGFQDGESYLVYAYRSGEKKDGPLSTSICTRTKTLANAKEDLDALGEGKEPEPKK